MVSLGLTILPLVVVFLFPSPTLQSCEYDDTFATEMSKEGYSWCWDKYDYLYVGGFKRIQGGSDDLRNFKEVKCCRSPQIHRGKPFTCTSADWELSFKKEGWATCPSGHFIRGLHRGGGHELNSIQWVTCCKPAMHPHWYKQCYDQDVSGDTLECNRNGFYVAGIHRGASQKLSSINQLRCCNMYDEILPLKSVLDVKTRTMDITVKNLGRLAHYLGYGWTGGCRGQFVGEDFLREGDTWRSHYQKGCGGHMSTTRLKIHYENFSFKVKNMEYLEPEIESMKPIIQDVGVINNQDSMATETNIKRQIKSVRTVTQSSSSRFKSGFGASVTLSYKSPGLIASAAAGTFKASVTLSGGNEHAQLNTEENGDINWDIVEVDEVQTTNGNSGTSYQITTSKTKVNVPYIATIQVQFTATLDGFLVWGGGPNGENPNYHESYRGSGDRPVIKYKIGTETVPFYKFLKQASQRGDSPWFWHLLKQNIPKTQTVLDELTDESLYEFTLHGKFHDVAGLDFNVQWNDVPVSNVGGSANATFAA